MEELLFPEAAEYLGVSPRTLKEYISRRMLPVLNTWILDTCGERESAVFSKADLDAYIRRRRKTHLLEGREREIASLLLDVRLTLAEIGRRFYVSGEAIRQKALRMGYTRKAVRRRTART